jgi:hypothetical protein
MAPAGSAIYKNNVLTAQHVSVPGSHVTLIPPVSAKKLAEAPGFEIPPRRIKVIITEKAAPYAKLQDTLTKEGLEAEGVAVSDISEVTLNNKPARLILGTATKKEGEEESEDLGVVLLVLGDENLTSFIFGFYPVSDKSAAGQLRGSLLSAILETKQKEAEGSYTLSAAGTSLKLRDEVGSTRYYEADAAAPPNSSKNNVLFTSTMLPQSVPLEEQADFAEKAFSNYLSAYEYTISSRKNVTYGGLPGIEHIADLDGYSRQVKTASGGTQRRKIPAKGYQVILFDNLGKVYSFNGVAVSDADNYLSQFIKITSTFKPGK